MDLLLNICSFQIKLILLNQISRLWKGARYSCMMHFSTVPSHPVGKHGWRIEGWDRRIRHTEGTVEICATFSVKNLNVILPKTVQRELEQYCSNVSQKCFVYCCSYLRQHKSLILGSSWTIWTQHENYLSNMRFFSKCNKIDLKSKVLCYFLWIKTNRSRLGWKHTNIRRWMQTSSIEIKCCIYLVVHCFLLADQLGAQDQHLLLADLQLLTGGVELVQQYLVSRGARGPSACSCITQQALPHLCQVMFQLLVLWFQLLTLRGEKIRGLMP